MFDIQRRIDAQFHRRAVDGPGHRDRGLLLRDAQLSLSVGNVQKTALRRKLPPGVSHRQRRTQLLEFDRRAGQRPARDQSPAQPRPPGQVQLLFQTRVDRRQQPHDGLEPRPLQIGEDTPGLAVPAQRCERRVIPIGGGHAHNIFLTFELAAGVKPDSLQRAEPAVADG